MPPYNAFWAASRTGGGTGALDALDGSLLADKDMSILAESTDTMRFWWLDADASGSEGEAVTNPDTNPGTKSWLLLGVTLPNSGLHILDTGTDHDLIFAVGEDLSQDTTLTLTLGDANRTLTLNENLTIGDGTNITITGVTQANTLTLNESFTIGDGNTGTLTFSASGDTLTVGESLTLDGASGKTLTLEENLTVSDGTDITLTGVTAARTITLNENLTIVDGQDVDLHASGGEKAQLAIDTQNAERTLDMTANLTIGSGSTVTLTAEDAAGAITLDNCGFEVEDTVGSGNTIKFIIGTDDASRTVTLSENLTIGDGTDITITGVTQANTLTLHESLTLGDGNDGTLTYSAASKTLTVADDCTVNQDLQTTDSPTFANLIIADAGNIGSVSDTDAIAIASGGEVTLSQTLILSDVVDAATDTDKFLVLDGSGNVDYRTGAEVLSDIGGGAPHAMLDGSVHTDSVADAVTRGSIIYANSTPKWDELVVGAANTFLGSDGTDLSYRSAAQVLASLSGAAGAAFSWNSQNLTSVGTIGCGTITIVDGSSLSLQEDITFTGATTVNLIKFPDNLADALSFEEGTTSYLKFITTDGSEAVQFGKDVGIGVAPTLAFQVKGQVTFQDLLNITDGYKGLYLYYSKTAGATGEEDDLFGLDVVMNMNDADSTIGHVRGARFASTLTSGTIGDGQEFLMGFLGTAGQYGGTINGGIRGFAMTVDVDAGTCDGSIFGGYVTVDIESAVTSITGSVYGHYIYIDVDKDPDGSAFALYIREYSGVDYCIYQNGTAPSHFGGDVDINVHDAATAGLKLGGTLVTASAAELNYSDGVTSAIQTQLDARCLESVFGTSISTGLLLDGTALKASAILQKYHGIDPSANVQSLLGAANYAAMFALLTAQAGAAFDWGGQNLTNLGTLAAGASTLTIDETVALSAKAPLASPNFTGTPLAPDHGAAATDMLVNVCYGTGAAPAAATTTIGSLYIKYIA